METQPNEKVIFSHVILLSVLFQPLSLTPDLGFKYHWNKRRWMSAALWYFIYLKPCSLRERPWLGEPAPWRVPRAGTLVYLLRISGPHTWRQVSQEISNSFCQSHSQPTAQSPGCDTPSPNSLWPRWPVSYVLNSRVCGTSRLPLTLGGWCKIKHRSGIFHQVPQGRFRYLFSWC